ncbi:formylglycine-generating enzyme family protein, partial [Burkholderia multivorans]
MRASTIGAALAAPLYGGGFAARYTHGPAVPDSAFDGANRDRPLAALGSEQQCARYSGLPANWRDDPKAGMVHLRGGTFVFGSTRGYQDERPAGDGRTR